MAEVKPLALYGGQIRSLAANDYGWGELSLRTSQTWTAAQQLQGQTNLGLLSRTPVADVAYTVTTADRLVAYTSLTAARTVTLPAASAYPAGATLTVYDEALACSSTVTLTVAAAGSDKINGAASAVMTVAGSYLALTSNGASKWTIVDSNVPTAASLDAAMTAWFAQLPTTLPTTAGKWWNNGNTPALS